MVGVPFVPVVKRPHHPHLLFVGFNARVEVGKPVGALLDADIHRVAVRATP